MKLGHFPWQTFSLLEALRLDSWNITVAFLEGQPSPPKDESPIDQKIMIGYDLRYYPKYQIMFFTGICFVVEFTWVCLKIAYP